MNITTKEILKIIKQFNFKSIFFNYWFKFTVILIVPFLCLNLLVYFTYSKATNEKISNTFSYSSFVAYSTFSRFVDNSDQLFTTLSSNTHISAYFSQPSNNKYFNAAQILSPLEQSIAKNSELYSIILYNFSNDYVLSTDGGNQLSKFRYLDWFNYYQKTRRTNFIINGTVYDYTIKGEQKLLTFCYGVYRQNRCCGLIVLNYRNRSVDKLLPTSDSNLFFLLDDDNSVLYSSNGAFIGEDLTQHYVFKIPSKDIALTREASYMSASCRFSVKPLSFVAITTAPSYTNRTPEFKVLLLIALITAILLPLLLSLYVAHSFYHSIAEIIINFNSVDTLENPDDHTNEIEFITQHFFRLSDKKSHIEHELANKISLLKQTQIVAMQLQFNQHFLFNTLNLISMMARTTCGGKNQISSAISKLSDLLRISLDTKQYIIPIAAEINYAKKYIEIEQMKLNDTFSVTWDIDEKIFDYKTIKLILQPILENALRYGLQLLPHDAQKHLKIIGKMNADKIIFHIIDNGPGFKPDVLEKMQKLLNDNILSENKHIGLTNVNSRIKLIFGEDYGIWISSNSTGTDVKIMFPKA